MLADRRSSTGCQRAQQESGAAPACPRVWLRLPVSMSRVSPVEVIPLSVDGCCLCTWGVCGRAEGALGGCVRCSFAGGPFQAVVKLAESEFTSRGWQVTWQGHHSCAPLYSFPKTYRREDGVFCAMALAAL